MKGQGIVNVEPGKVALWDLQLPDAGPCDVVVDTRHSMISPGTERSVLMGGPSGLLCSIRPHQHRRPAAGAAEVIGFEPLEERRELALELGAGRCFHPASAEASGFREQPQGAQVDAAIDCSSVKDSVQSQMDIAGGGFRSSAFSPTLTNIRSGTGRWPSSVTVITGGRRRNMRWCEFWTAD